MIAPGPNQFRTRLQAESNISENRAFVNPWTPDLKVEAEDEHDEDGRCEADGDEGEEEYGDGEDDE